MMLKVAKRISNHGGSLVAYLDAPSVVYLDLYSDEDAYARELKNKIVVCEESTNVSFTTNIKVDGKGSFILQFKKEIADEMKLKAGEVRAFFLENVPS